VTGATGFIGSHLATRLVQDGWDVHILSRPASAAASFVRLLGQDHVHTHDGTIDSMLGITERSRPSHILHLAALFVAQHKSQDVTDLIRSNVELTAQLAEAAAVHKVPHFINTGTAWQHFDNEAFNPATLYAATKQASADILQYFAEAGAFCVVNLELFDTYGPGDPRRKLFTLLREFARTGEPLFMSPGDQSIDLTYIDDVIDAYITATVETTLPDLPPFRTFAVSSGTPRRLHEVVALWQKVARKFVNVQWGALRHRPREIMMPWSRGTRLPNWQPRTSLEEGIRLMEAHAEAAP
jgi:nucleoside-diphosphate-sugar epimerase